VFYRMDRDGRVQEEPDVVAWSQWIRTADRVIVQTAVPNETTGGQVKVLTVFIGLDHQFSEGPPILFETVVDGGERGKIIGRYSTIEEARRGHAEIVESIAQPLTRGEENRDLRLG
jgi:hypothetical protein